MKKRYTIFLQILIGISLAAAFSAATIAQPEEIGKEAKNLPSVSDTIFDMEARLKSLLEEQEKLVEEREKLDVELQSIEIDSELNRFQLDRLLRLVNQYKDDIARLTMMNKRKQESAELMLDLEAEE